MNNLPHRVYLQNILDMATGMDGGGAYIRLREMLDEMANRAQKGDTASVQILAIVKQFSKLIDVANKTI